MTSQDRDEGDTSPSVSTCTAPDCDRTAALRLHVPWDDDRILCPAHARVQVQADGVVPEPIDEIDEVWP